MGSGMHYVLCLNSGSSSLKYALYRMTQEDESLLAQGAAERIGLAGGRLWTRAGRRASLLDTNRDFPDHQAAVEAAFSQIEQLRLARPTLVGHRIVHGGIAHFDPVRVDRQLIAELGKLIAFAPLHLPAEIAGIEAIAARFPDLIQVACFDTAFHRRMPELAQRFPLPGQFWEEGLRRFGISRPFLRIRP